MDENGNEKGVNLQCITGSKTWKDSQQRLEGEARGDQRLTRADKEGKTSMKMMELRLRKRVKSKHRKWEKDPNCWQTT